jgi:Flp pilus assembly protein TadD
MARMRPTLLSLLVGSAGLASCALHGPPVSAPGGPGPAAPAGSAQPAPATAEQPASGRPGSAAPRQFHLGPASSALVAQAHTQAGSGDFPQAAATLERALRIEPDNPLLWIELGRVRLGEQNPAQADAMARKALTLAGGDALAQSSAWHLIADSLRARGRDPDAAQAEQRAATLASH